MVNARSKNPAFLHLISSLGKYDQCEATSTLKHAIVWTEYSGWNTVITSQCLKEVSTLAWNTTALQPRCQMPVSPSFQVVSVESVIGVVYLYSFYAAIAAAGNGEIAEIHKSHKSVPSKKKENLGLGKFWLNGKIAFLLKVKGHYFPLAARRNID